MGGGGASGGSPGGRRHRAGRADGARELLRPRLGRRAHVAAGRSRHVRRAVGRPSREQPRVVEIPVRYDGEDLDDVARATGARSRRGHRAPHRRRRSASTSAVSHLGSRTSEDSTRRCGCPVDRHRGPGYRRDRSRSPTCIRPSTPACRQADGISSGRRRLGSGTPIATRPRCSSRAPRSGSSPHDGSGDRGRRHRLVDDDPGSGPTGPRPSRRADRGRCRPGARRARQPAGRQRRARRGARDSRWARGACHRSGSRRDDRRAGTARPGGWGSS